MCGCARACVRACVCVCVCVCVREGVRARVQALVCFFGMRVRASELGGHFGLGGHLDLGDTWALESSLQKKATTPYTVPSRYSRRG
jgi:hypothetical protein